MQSSFNTTAARVEKIHPLDLDDICHLIAIDLTAQRDTILEGIISSFKHFNFKPSTENKGDLVILAIKAFQVASCAPLASKYVNACDANTWAEAMWKHVLADQAWEAEVFRMILSRYIGPEIEMETAFRYFREDIAEGMTDDYPATASFVIHHIPEVTMWGAQEVISTRCGDLALAGKIRDAYENNSKSELEKLQRTKGSLGPGRIDPVNKYGPPKAENLFNSADYYLEQTAIHAYQTPEKPAVLRILVNVVLTIIAGGLLAYVVGCGVGIFWPSLQHPLTGFLWAWWIMQGFRYGRAKLKGEI